MDIAKADTIKEAKDTLKALLALFELPDQKAVKILDELLYLSETAEENLKETA